METVKAILDLLGSDKSGEDRTNSLMVLVRYVVCLCILLHFVFCGFLSARGYYPINAVYLVSSLILIIIFVLSYHMHRSDIIVILTAVTNYAVCAITGSFLGWIVSGYGFMYVTLMLVWFDSSKENRFKIAISAFVSASVCVLFGIRGAQLDIQLEHADYVVMLVINTVILCGCISVVAYFLCKDNVSDERKLLQYNAKLKQMAGIDPLTGLMNRRAIGEKFEELLKGETQNVTVAMGDIDFFKKVNDTRGHDCGDYVLKTLASLFQDFMKDKGYVSRWGGEEFVFIFSEINGDDAYPMLEELRRKIEGMELEFFSHKFNITMTFGMEEYSPMFGSEEAIKKADEKLYMGKESGRNQVVY
ncbi:MAG: GGDEF domain-containing protein [Lachnospiraceae bacterium]|nr:GGDEF domain-containing protein [Lachnospiraceae bacterium]